MILDCQNISKAFGTNVILDNVSFHLDDKEKMERAAAVLRESRLAKTVFATDVF